MNDGQTIYAQWGGNTEIRGIYRRGSPVTAIDPGEASYVEDIQAKGLDGFWRCIEDEYLDADGEPIGLDCATEALLEQV